MQQNFNATIMGLSIMIIPFLSCCICQPNNHPQMKELKLRNAEILELNTSDQSN